jgi:hypothetical protein
MNNALEGLNLFGWAAEAAPDPANLMPGGQVPARFSFEMKGTPKPTSLKDWALE